MPRKREKSPSESTEEIKPPDLEVERLIEETEGIELQENHDVKEGEIEELKQEIEEELASMPEHEKEDPEKVQERILKYQEKYLPDHLREKPWVFTKMVKNIALSFLKFEREGIENKPEGGGGFLVVSNHFGNEGGALMKEFQEDNIHVAVGEEIWWNKSKFMQWVFKKMGTISVKESLAHLSKEEKEAAIESQDSWGKKVFKDIIEREEKGEVPINKDFIRGAVATLLKGEAVAIFPEGLWLNREGSALNPREKAEMKQGYQGIELIAKEYKRVSGRELPILPTALDEDRKTGKSKLIIGEQLSSAENNSELSDTDWVMANVAKLLPEEQRGYYKGAVESLPR